MPPPRALAQADPDANPPPITWRALGVWLVMGGVFYAGQQVAEAGWRWWRRRRRRKR